MVIRVRARAYEASRADFEAELSRQVRAVIEGYWAQYLAAQQVRVQEESLTLAKKLLEEAEAGVSVGTQPPLAVSQAEAQVALRTEELLAAQNRLATAANQLKRLLGTDEALAQRLPLQLADRPTVVARDFDEESSVAAALEQRAELRAQKGKVQAAELTRRITRNQTLPELNFVGTVGVEGLAGRASDNGFSSDPIDPMFIGRLEDAIDQAGQGDFYRYEAGVTLRYPLGNRTAKARATRSELELSQTQARLRGLTQEVGVEVRNSIGTLRTAVLRIEAARRAREFAQQSLTTGQERYKVGLATTREVLELQRDNTEAASSFEQALVDYQNSFAEVLRVRGELLSSYGVALEQ
jgi:outer membrane protein TolC